MPLFARLYGNTRNGTLLDRVPLGVVTWSLPVVAPDGTVVVISEGETTLNVAGVPLNVTLDALVRFVPRILTVVPTLPNVGRVLRNGARPTERLYIVPRPLDPPRYVVP